MKFEKIHCDDYTIELIEPIYVRATLKSECAFLEYRILNIFATGDDMFQAVADFEDTFCFLYERFGLAKDEELEEKAIKLKNKINSMISEVIHNA